SCTSPISLSLYLGLHEPIDTTLFPYTTLFRSSGRRGKGRVALEREDAGIGVGLVLLVLERLDLRGVERPAGGQAHEAEALAALRSEEHTSELQSPYDLVCRLLLEKKKNTTHTR